MKQGCTALVSIHLEVNTNIMSGYHTTIIPRGIYGEVSKILEEVNELKDAIRQGAKIMELCELSDIIGAIDGYLKNHHPGTSMNDLIKMASLTARAFEVGERKAG